MQIHELNKRRPAEQQLNEVDIVGPNGLINRAKTTLKTLKKPGAGTALAQATSKDTFNFGQSTWMDMYRQSQADQATQTWINGLNKMWKAQGPKMPAPQQPSGYQATYQPPKPTVAKTAQPAPRKPLQATTVPTRPDLTKISAPPKPGAPTPAEQEKLQQRIQAAMAGKKDDLHEAINMNNFRTWSDRQLATTDHAGQPITMDMVRKDPAIGHNLEQLLSAVERTDGQSAEFDQAFSAYMTAAAAGIRMLVQQSNQRRPQATAQTSTGTQQYASSGLRPLPTSVARLFKAMGVANPTQENILALRRYLDAEGVGRLPDTGSPSLDQLFQVMGKK